MSPLAPPPRLVRPPFSLPRSLASSARVSGLPAHAHGRACTNAAAPTHPPTHAPLCTLPPPLCQQELVVNPAHQELDPLHWVLAWSDVLPPNQARTRTR